MDMTIKMLPILQAGALSSQGLESPWLIHSLWTRAAVGIIGGAPKCCKSWFGLDMAVSVSSATPCLGRFPVECPGPALIFLAEDALASVRARIEALCTHRGLLIDKLDLYVITIPALRLDLHDDQARLEATLAALKPRLLVLDPLVRLHRRDENSAADIAALLGFVRELQRTYDAAIALVHHAGKKHHAQPGQALRGSSDLHAFGDSNAYLARRNGRLILTLEHRSAKSPEPIELILESRPDNSATHLEIAPGSHTVPDASLAQHTLAFLQGIRQPLTRTAIRRHLKVNNQKLGHALDNLAQKQLITKTPQGWLAVSGCEAQHPPAPQNVCQPLDAELRQQTLPLKHQP